MVQKEVKTDEGVGTRSQAEQLIAEYIALWPDDVEQSRLVQKYIWQEFAEGKVGDQITANPYQYGNTEYVRYSNFYRELFLTSRLQGRVIDIGSAGVDELDGIVPSDQVTYIDNNPQQQANFHQVNVGEQPLPFEDQSFDSAFIRNTIQTAEHAQTILPETLRVIRPGGLIVIETQCLPVSIGEPVLGVLTALEKQGIDLDTQVEVLMDRAYIQHTRFPLKFNHPTIFIVVKKV